MIAHRSGAAVVEARFPTGSSFLLARRTERKAEVRRAHLLRGAALIYRQKSNVDGRLPRIGLRANGVRQPDLTTHPPCKV